MEEYKDLLEYMNSQIQSELETGGVAEAAEDTNENAEKVSRKPFRISDFDLPRDKEMAVFTHAKKLSEYLFVITEKSPVKLRWSIVSRLLNTSIDVIESLYRANYERDEERVIWQKKAMVSLNLLDFYADTAKTKRAISFRQLTIIARQISEVKTLLNGWIRSTKRKY